MTGKATLRQIDIQRAIRAAKKEGAARVVLTTPNGACLSIEIDGQADISPQSPQRRPAPAKDFVL